jgi:hypothetical protein
MNTSNTHWSAGVFARLLVAGLTVFLLALFSFSTASSHASTLKPRPSPTPGPTLTPSPPPSSGTWTMTGSMNQDRDTFTATLLQNGQVLVAGGDEDQYPLASDTAELYNPSKGTWTYTSGLMQVARTAHTATLLPNGQVLVAGGCIITPTDGCYAIGSAELYTPSIGTWTYTGSLHNPRSLHIAALLSNSKVLVAGGILCTYSTVGCNLAELYTP